MMSQKTMNRNASTGLIRMRDKPLEIGQMSESLTDDEEEAKRIKKEKVKWKYLKDEEQRDKVLLNLKEKLEQP